MMGWFIAGIAVSLVGLTGFACVRVGADDEGREGIRGPSSVK
jgi:hypothetical protein